MTRQEMSYFDISIKYIASEFYLLTFEVLVGLCEIEVQILYEYENKERGQVSKIVYVLS